MEIVLSLLKDTLLYLLNTLVHNAPALILGLLVAAAMQTYVDPEKMRAWLMRRSSVSIPATVLFGAFTPFCACGTMAVVLAMLATALPWGPVMAFLTSSPLMSPEGFVLMSGMLGPAFAVTLAVASVLIGLGSGYATHLIEKKTHFLDNQLRFAGKKYGGLEQTLPTSTCGCATSPAAEVSCCGGQTQEGSCGCDGGEAPAASCGCDAAVLPRPQPVLAQASFFRRFKLDKLLKSLYEIGVKRILPYFALFAAIGYLINRFIPVQWVSALFGAGHGYAVPLAAAVGLPLYVNGDSSIPLLQSLMQSGVGGGAMLAFMITGPGTSAGVLAGIATIMRKRAIALYVAFLLGGGILMGYAYDLILLLLGR